MDLFKEFKYEIMKFRDEMQKNISKIKDGKKIYDLLKEKKNLINIENDAIRRKNSSQNYQKELQILSEKINMEINNIIKIVNIDQKYNNLIKTLKKEKEERKKEFNISWKKIIIILMILFILLIIGFILLYILGK